MEILNPCLLEKVATSGNINTNRVSRFSNIMRITARYVPAAIFLSSKVCFKTLGNWMNEKKCHQKLEKSLTAHYWTFEQISKTISAFYCNRTFSPIFWKKLGKKDLFQLRRQTDCFSEKRTPLIEKPKIFLKNLFFFAIRKRIVLKSI